MYICMVLGQASPPAAQRPLPEWAISNCLPRCGASALVSVHRAFRFGVHLHWCAKTPSYLAFSHFFCISGRRVPDLDILCVTIFKFFYALAVINLTSCTDSQFTIWTICISGSAVAKHRLFCGTATFNLAGGCGDCPVAWTIFCLCVVHKWMCSVILILVIF